MGCDSGEEILNNLGNLLKIRHVPKIFSEFWELTLKVLITREDSLKNCATKSMRAQLIKVFEPASMNWVFCY